MTDVTNLYLDLLSEVCPIFFNKSYQRSNEVTTDSSYKAFWIINMMYLSFSFSRYSQSRPCSIAMYCTSHLTLRDVVIWYKRNTGVLCFQPSITYSYLQDVPHYYGSLKNVTIKIRGHILNQPFPVQVPTAVSCSTIIQCTLQCFETNFPKILLTLAFPTLRLSWPFDLFTGRVLDKLEKN